MNKLQIILIFFALSLFCPNVYAQSVLKALQQKIELEKYYKEGYLTTSMYHKEVKKLNYEAKLHQLNTNYNASDEYVKAILTYDKYLRNKTSVSETEVIDAAETILSESPKAKFQAFGYVAAILRTLPKGALKDYTSESLSCYRYCLNNGKILMCNGWINEFVRGVIVEYVDYYLPERKLGILYNPDGTFGIGYLIKKSDANKKYFPNVFVNQGLPEINKQEDYVIGIGYICNDKETTDNLALFEYCLGLTSVKPNGYPWAIQYLYCSDSDIEALKSAKDMAKDLAEKKAEEKAWAPYVKKYGATAVKRAKKLDVWIGMPKELALASGFRFVRSTESYGAKIEIYTRSITYLRETIQIRNGRVIKVSTIRTMR